MGVGPELASWLAVAWLAAAALLQVPLAALAAGEAGPVPDPLGLLAEWWEREFAREGLWRCKS